MPHTPARYRIGMGKLTRVTHSSPYAQASNSCSAQNLSIRRFDIAQRSFRTLRLSIADDMSKSI